jgi:hypothetical protein
MTSRLAVFAAVGLIIGVKRHHRTLDRRHRSRSGQKSGLNLLSL